MSPDGRPAAELDGQRLSWFSTIATIGTPQDVTLEELCIESLFPADDETDAAVRELAVPRREWKLL